MPEPDPVRLGSGHIRLEAEVVHFLPSKWQAWRGISAASFAYADVASVVMTEPEGFGRGTLVLRLDDGESYSMSFGSNRLSKMRQTYRELWRHVQEARGGKSGPGR
jgi:hypothetical protein